MAMLQCPHCDGPGISTIRKLYLGPAIPATCRTCGRKIGVPYVRSFLAVLPLVIPTFALVALPGLPMPIRVLCVVIGVAGVFYVSLKYVPLVKR